MAGKKILVTGGAGYVGAVLIPELLKRGYSVKVLDLFMFDENIFNGIKKDKSLEVVKGDIRNRKTLENVLEDMDAVIHLAAISNDPCSELNPELTQQVNYDAIINLVRIAKDKGVQRFIAASSSSVYGIKSEPEVTEDLPLEPITLYAKLKARSEEIIRKEADENFVPVCIRSATVCGYSPRMRLDLTVNILTSHAVNKNLITVFGGQQKRPNVYIDDIVGLYADLIEAPADSIRGEVFNFGAENYKVIEIARMVRETVGDTVKIEVTESNDERSYYISSQRIKKQLGYYPKNTIKQAIINVKDAFKNGLIPDYQNTRYYNVKKMIEMNMK